MLRARDTATYDTGDEDYVEVLQRELAQLALKGRAGSGSPRGSHKGSPKVSLGALGLVGSGGSLGGAGLSPYAVARAAAAAAASASAPGSAAASPPASPAGHAHSASASASASASPKESRRSAKGGLKASRAGKSKDRESSRRASLQDAHAEPGVQNVHMFYLEATDAKGGLKKGSKGGSKGGPKGKKSVKSGCVDVEEEEEEEEEASGSMRGGLRSRRQQLQARRRERTQSVDLTGRVEDFEGLIDVAMGHNCLKPTMISLPTATADHPPSTSTSTPAASMRTSATTSPTTSNPSTPLRAARVKSRSVWGEPRLVSAGSHPKGALESILREEGVASPRPVPRRRERRRGTSQEHFPDPMESYFEGDSLADCGMTSAGDMEREKGGERVGKRGQAPGDCATVFKRSPSPPDAQREGGESAPADRRQILWSRSQETLGSNTAAVGAATERHSRSMGTLQGLQPQKGEAAEAAPEDWRTASYEVTEDSEPEFEGVGGRPWVIDPLQGLESDNAPELCDKEAPGGSFCEKGAEYGTDGTAGFEGEEGHEIGAGEDEEGEEEVGEEIESEEELEYEEEEIEYEEEELEYEEHSVASPRAEDEWEAAERRHLQGRVEGGEGEEGDGAGGSLEGVHLEKQLHKARMSYDCGGPSALLRVAIFNNLRMNSGVTDDMCPTP